MKKPLSVRKCSAELQFIASSSSNAQQSLEELVSAANYLETSLPQVYYVEQLGLEPPLPQTLGELDAIVCNGRLSHTLSEGGGVVVVQALLDKLRLVELSDELQMKLWTILPEILRLENQQVAVQIADQTTLLDAVLQTLQPHSDGKMHQCFYWALKCVTMLKQHGLMIYPLLQRAIVTAVVDSIHDGLDRDCAELLVRALKAFSTESVACAMEIERLTGFRLACVSRELKLLLLQIVVTQRNLSYRAYDPQWDALEHTEWIFRILKGGTQFEKLVALEALLPVLSDKAGARRFFRSGGVSVLVALTLLPSVPVQNRAQALLSVISSTDEHYLGALIASQLRYPKIDLLPSEFCIVDFSNFDWFSFPECMHSLRSRQEAEVRHALDKLLPRNMYILAALCLDHELISILLTLIKASYVGDTSKDTAWTLLMEMSYELPAIGITNLQDTEQLIMIALQMLRAEDECPLMRRQQAVRILLGPLSTSIAARDVLINDQGAIPELVHFLAHEDDEALAEALCDLVRSLAAETPSYSAEINLIIQSLLDRGSDDFAHFASLRFQNLLSVYRKPKKVILGLAGEDAIPNLKLNIEILLSGNEVERHLVLQQLRIRAASWSQAHWDMLAQHVLEIVDIVLCETAEFKKLAIELLRILAAVDDGCRAKVLSAQRIYRTSDPAFFEEFMVSDDSRDNSMSKFEEPDDDDDGDFEMQESEQLEEPGWVAVDLPVL